MTNTLATQQLSLSHVMEFLLMSNYILAPGALKLYCSGSQSYVTIDTNETAQKEKPAPVSSYACSEGFKVRSPRFNVSKGHRPLARGPVVPPPVAPAFLLLLLEILVNHAVLPQHVWRLQTINDE
jgi:hypothetical protein